MVANKDVQIGQGGIELDVVGELENGRLMHKALSQGDVPDRC